eukprot:GCRY01002884.1.p1 GENE.GCRY01002884.1~~GCRY01002884.1.p1  ORF type:complete len:433 (+),score=74.03 GCRY01002884.1:259-1557(+)
MDGTRFLLGNTKLFLMMVGLPARGKSYVSQKLCRYLIWRGVNCKVLHAGNFRRMFIGCKPVPSDYYDITNEDSKAMRLKVEQLCVKEMLSYLSKEGRVAIYDATNLSLERRARIKKTVQAHSPDLQLVCIECTSDDESRLDLHIDQMVKTSPEYQDMSVEEAKQHLKERINWCRQEYVPISDSENMPFIKLHENGRQMELSGIDGYVMSNIVYFLMNVHTQHFNKAIYLTRHGESMFNTVLRIGGDSCLSPRGHKYSRALSAHVRSLPDTIRPQNIWTSTLQRTIQTSEPLLDIMSRNQWKSLDEIDAGVCDGMTYKEIEEQLPEIHLGRKADKYYYRYPRGESYADLVERLDPMILELERVDSPILVVGHQAILRVIVAYFMGNRPDEIPYMKIPLHTLIKITPKPYFCEESRMFFDIDGKENPEDTPHAH